MSVNVLYTDIRLVLLLKFGLLAVFITVCYLSHCFCILIWFFTGYHTCSR